MKIAMVGSRNFERYSKVAKYFIDNVQAGDMIISGGAEGIDRTAENIARGANMSVCILLPDWNKYGKSAGARRNQQIVDMADKVVAFWDGKSKGTKITIDMARKAGKPLEIIYDESI